VVAALLLLNLGVNLSPTAHAVPKKQYKAVNAKMSALYDANGVQRALDQQSAEGWEYVGSVGLVLVFNK